MNVLFVGAHPDDIECSVGGTALRYAKQGDKLFFCVATNGNVGSSTHTQKEIRDIRYEEAKKAAEIVGAQLIWLDFDDEFLIDSRETRNKFIDAIRIARPDVVFCHYLDDYNPDHSISGRLVDECVSMAKIPLIKTEHEPTGKIPIVYYMDTPGGVNFLPEVYVDITTVFDKKAEMVAQHVSQNAWMTDLFGYDLSTFLEIPAKYRGIQAGCKMAEGFRLSKRWGRMLLGNHLLPGCSCK